MFMKKIFIAAVSATLVSVACADDATWVTAGSADWNDDVNWMLADGSAAFPDAEFDDTPVITNGGIAFLEEPALGNATPFSSVTVGGNQGGGIELRDGAELSAETLSLEDPGSLSLAGSASLTVTGDANTVGVTTISGPAANYSVGGSYTVGGTFEAVISDAAHSPVKVDGAANVSGTLRPAFDGVEPALGNSWPLIDAGSVVGSFSSIDTSQLPALEAGVIYTTAVNTAEGNIDLVVTNTLDLVVDRRTGTASIRNVVGDAISVDNLTITSPSGQLNPDGWTSFSDSGAAGGGWAEGDNSNQSLSESRADGPTTIAVGSPIEIGSAVASPVNFAPEDIELSYSSEGVTLPGVVTYEGIPYNLVLNVDPATGATEITNQATVPIEFDGYAVVSASGALQPADGAWSSLADSGVGGAGWEEANPSADAVAELNPTGTTTLAPSESLALGTLVDPAGAQDLSFSFFYSGDTLGSRDGFVAYGFEATDPPACAPVNSLNGDLDGNGEVAFADFLTLSANFGASDVGYAAGDVDCNGEVAFADFLTLSANFGQTIGGAHAVPEPSGLRLLAWTGLILICRLRRK